MIRARLQESTGYLKGAIYTHRPTLKCTMRSLRPVLKGFINISQRSADIYDGEYIVTPKPFIEQTLETRDKMMINDVTVLEIPYFETSNISGITVYIGGE